MKSYIKTVEIWKRAVRKFISDSFVPMSLNCKNYIFKFAEYCNVIIQLRWMIVEYYRPLVSLHGINVSIKDDICTYYLSVNNISKDTFLSTDELKSKTARPWTRCVLQLCIQKLW